jgi:hypothetical protein
VVIDKMTARGDRAEDATAALLGPELPCTVVLCTAPNDPLLARCEQVYEIRNSTLVPAALEGLR